MKLYAVALLCGVVSCDATPYAEALVKNMTFAEKAKLLHGVENLEPREHYVGIIDGIPSLQIPKIKMNDGPQGFRSADYPGSSTQFPASLSIGASFSTATAARWAHGISLEFKEKGADIYLGPGVCLARIPHNGRNFEYISGEDPVLGAILVRPIIKSMQGNDVLATVKHFILNSQETDRTKVDAIVDERTIMEAYAAPFLAAVEEGVATVMCSYNLVNGEHACQQNNTLIGILRDQFHFQGWVMSDWLATHSTTSIAKGLAQEMPLGVHFSEEALELARLAGEISIEDIDNAVTTYLSTLDRFGVLNRTTARPATPYLNVTSAESREICEDVITDSAILLKNTNKILPLTKANLKKVIVCGEAAKDTSKYGGLGSGRVKPSHPTSILAGMETEIGAVEHYDGKTKENVAKAVEAAADADLVLVVLAENSKEGADRTTLALPQADFAEALSNASSKCVVIVLAPGAVTTDFDTNTAAVLLSFMPGQQAGVALPRLLFAENKITPTGRLPITLPHTENDQNFTPEQWPGVPDGKEKHRSTYTEKLAFGYRWYTMHGKMPKYSFGHGLTYSTFNLSDVEFKGSNSTVTVSVANSGAVLDTAVVQCYVTFPSSGGDYQEPARQLKGFTKVTIVAGTAQHVAIPLQTLQTWDSRWVVPTGEYTLEVGWSVTDIRQTIKFTL